MNKLKALLPVLLILLLLLTVVPATAEEAENLTGGLTVKTVDMTANTPLFGKAANRRIPG